MDFTPDYSEDVDVDVTDVDDEDVDATTDNTSEENHTTMKLF